MPLRRRICDEFATSARRRARLRRLCRSAPRLPSQVGFLADHYDISATLDSSHQSISAIAKIDFRATDRLPAIIRVELASQSGRQRRNNGRRQVGRIWPRLDESSLRPGHSAHTRRHRGPRHAHVHLLRLARQRRKQPVPGVRAAVIGHDRRLLCCFPRAGSLSRTIPPTATPPRSISMSRTPSPWRVLGKSFGPNAAGGNGGGRRRTPSVHFRVHYPRSPRHFRRRKSATQSQAIRRHRGSRLRSALRFR